MYGPITGATAAAGPPNMPSDTEKTRFRSFAERYMVERAKTFPAGMTDSEELECAYRVLQIAERVYKNIEDKAEHLNMNVVP
jgi:hypothetical protein